MQNPAAIPQPMPTPGRQDVLPEIIKDLKARTAVGIANYGYPLQTHNGRDALMDAYQEALDLTQYLKQALLERDKANDCAANIGEPPQGLVGPFGQMPYGG